MAFIVIWVHACLGATSLPAHVLLFTGPFGQLSEHSDFSVVLELRTRISCQIGFSLDLDLYI